MISFVEPGVYDSWTVIDEATVVKHMDKSVFQNHGSGIPKSMAMFFDEWGLQPGDRHGLKLSVRGIAYDAYIHRGSANGFRYRMFWTKSLENKIRDIFDYDFIRSTGDFPYMTFNRRGEGEYEVFFSDGRSLELEDDEGVYSGCPIDDELFERLIHRKSDRELEVIIGEMSLDDAIPVERKTTIVRRIIRDRAISSYVKERAGYRCEICGVQGFLKEGGGRYAEAHHMLELGKMHDDVMVEHSDFMICVCPTCHRVIHYGARSELDSRLKP